jgi:hypothetical protein
VRTDLCDGELSIGDYVLGGGEVAAMVVLEAVARLVPGVMGNQASAEDESFSDGLLDRNAAEAWRGTVLRAEPLDEPVGDDDEGIWVHELIGSAVVLVDGTEVGTVVEVQANPASDLLVLDTEALVPVVFVTDHEPGRVTIDPPEGLFDL